MRKLLSLLAMLISVQAAFGDVMFIRLDGYCYLEGQTDHSGTKVKFIKVSPSAVTDSTYTDSSGYFFITDLHEGIYDVEYTHSAFDTVMLEDQTLIANMTIPPVTLLYTSLSGSLKGTLGPGIYRVVEGISVNSGDTLTILPGTTLRFDGPSFTICGTLLAEGAESDSIIFTAEQNGVNYWAGFYFSGSGSSGSRLALCLIAKSNAGGIKCYDSSSPTITNCTISDNSANSGGGVYCSSSSPTFTGCTCGSNSANYGGGVFCDNYSSPAFSNCTLSGNLAGQSGGGVVCTYSSPIFTNSSLTGNSAMSSGGGVYCYGYSSPIFTNCTISGNSMSIGGGVYCYYSAPTFNSTIVAFSTGAGFYFWSSAASQIQYCDIFGNSGGDIAFYDNSPSQGPLIIGRLVTTNVNGDSCDTYYNIFVDPMFADTAGGDFHLTDLSHCIGAGDPADTVSTDYEGDPRPNPSWSFPDIGADEHWSGSPVLHLVVSMSSGNAVLHWTPFGAGPYSVYGAIAPFTAGTLLDTVSDTTTWTDEETASRPSRYFYHVMAEWPSRAGEDTHHGE